MPSWNVILQFQTSSGHSKCRRFSIAGTPRACRILVYACDTFSNPTAAVAHAKIDAQLRSHSSANWTDCCGPGMWGCQAWSEPSCRQILVPVIGAPISNQVETDMLNWIGQAGVMSTITPALLPAIAHAVAFQGRSPALSRLSVSDWFGHPGRLAVQVLRAALHFGKPSIFISYRRADAGALADQLFDALAHEGFRVFLDRFSGTPGRYFPQELAEEMSDKAVLLVIETPGLMQSKWTLWEIAFAHRYRLGLIALQTPGGPAHNRIGKRLSITPTGHGVLTGGDLANAMAFIREEHVVAGLKRAAFYQGLIAAAAVAGKGSIIAHADGLLFLNDRSGNQSAIISAVGRPGQTGDIRALAEVKLAPPIARVLMGQHRHLPPDVRDDLNWLAGETTVELLGHYEGYRRVKALC